MQVLDNPGTASLAVRTVHNEIQTDLHEAEAGTVLMTDPVYLRHPLLGIPTQAAIPDCHISLTINTDRCGQP